MSAVSNYLLLLALMSLCLMLHNINDGYSNWDPTESFWNGGKPELILAISWCFNSIAWFIKFFISLKG